MMFLSPGSARTLYPYFSEEVHCSPQARRANVAISYNCGTIVVSSIIFGHSSQIAVSAGL